MNVFGKDIDVCHTCKPKAFMLTFDASFQQAEYERKANPNDRGQQALLEEMRAHVKKVMPTTINTCIHF